MGSQAYSSWTMAQATGLHGLQPNRQVVASTEEEGSRAVQDSKNLSNGRGIERPCQRTGGGLMVQEFALQTRTSPGDVPVGSGRPELATAAPWLTSNSRRRPPHRGRCWGWWRSGPLSRGCGAMAGCPLAGDGSGALMARGCLARMRDSPSGLSPRPAAKMASWRSLHPGR
jgi:hypothetical protein